MLVTGGKKKRCIERRLSSSSFRGQVDVLLNNGFQRIQPLEEGQRLSVLAGLLPAAGIFGRHCSEARRPGHESRCYLAAVRWAGARSRGGGRRRWMHLFFLPPVTSTASPRGLNVLLV